MADQLCQERCILWAQIDPLQEIRAALQSTEQGLLSPPARNERMVPRTQHLWHSPSPKDSRARVMWPLQQPAGVGILKGCPRVTQHTRQQPGDGIDDDHRRQLATGEHIVTDGDLVGDQVLAHPLIHSLVPPADKKQALLLATSQFERNGLGKKAPLGAQKYDRHVHPIRQNGLHSSEDGLRLHHHSTSPAVRGIIRNPVFASRVIADVVKGDGKAAALLSPLEDTFLQGATKHRGEKREDIDVHTQQSKTNTEWPTIGRLFPTQTGRKAANKPTLGATALKPPACGSSTETA
jgi:hypothetical protein